MKLTNRSLQLVCAVAATCTLAGCVSSTQTFDFGRTEVARILADVAGQIFLIFVQATSPFSGA